MFVFLVTSSIEELLLIKKHVCDWFGCIYTVFKCRGHVEMTSIMGVVLFRLLN